MDAASRDGLTAVDYATIADNWWIVAYLTKNSGHTAGSPNVEHKTRGQAASQRRHPPVRVNDDGAKGGRR